MNKQNEIFNNAMVNEGKGNEEPIRRELPRPSNLPPPPRPPKTVLYRSCIVA